MLRALCLRPRRCDFRLADDFVLVVLLRRNGLENRQQSCYIRFANRLLLLFVDVQQQLQQLATAIEFVLFQKQLSTVGRNADKSTFTKVCFKLNKYSTTLRKMFTNAPSDSFSIRFAIFASLFMFLSHAI